MISVARFSSLWLGAVDVAPARSGPGAAAQLSPPRVLRGRPSSGPARRVPEPWRDWAALTLLSQGTLVAVTWARPGLPWVLAAGVALGLVWATGTLTVLHDAGHRRFSSRAWPNILAVHTAVPAGVWVAHWTRKHRVHHRLTQVYPFDEPTRSSGLVRLHPEADWRPVHRHQHLYAWFLYALVWAGELRSQITYLTSGSMADEPSPTMIRRAASFTAEKLLCVLILAPYAALLGWLPFVLLFLTSLTVASVLIAVVTAVGHINVGIAPEVGRPAPDRWVGHVVRTTASFSTRSPVMRWVTGGMTHHVAHHLRPVAPRAELDALHRDVVPAMAARAGAAMVEFPTFVAAVRGHWHRLRDLGQPDGV